MDVRFIQQATQQFLDSWADAGLKGNAHVLEPLLSFCSLWQ